MEAEGAHAPRGTVAEVALLALRLGFTAFGGPSPVQPTTGGRPISAT